MSAKKEDKSKVEQSKKEEAAEEKPVAEEAEEFEDLEIVSEKMLTINFGKVWIAPRKKRAPKAIKVMKEYMKRHMKAEDIIISNEINDQVWSRGIEKPPRKLKVRAVKDKENRVIVFPIKT